MRNPARIVRSDSRSVPTFRKTMTGLMLGAALLASCAAPATQNASGQDVAAPSSAWRLEGQAMAAAADPRAVDAALEVMREGGNAIDAALAAHTVLGLVEPQSSGLGGGGYLVYYDHATGKVTVYDGRETAPMSATPKLFVKDGKVMDFGPAVISGRSVGTPGAVALYKAAHDDHGKLAWGKAFEPAIKLADEGFIVSDRLASFLTYSRFKDGPLAAGAESGAYFYPNGEPLKSGVRRPNKAYADTLRAIAKDGPSAFYTGAIAESIVKAVHSGETPGALSLEDLAAYKVRVVDGLCRPWRDKRICSAPPSSSGGVAMNLIMGLYDRLSKASPDTGEAADLRDFVLSEQLAYADRDHYVADPDAVSVPVDDLLNPAYLDARAAGGFKPGDIPVAGDPGQVLRGKPIIDMWGRDLTTPNPGTTHMSFVDFDGNAVSYTATIESPFGSYRWASGFLLNNELTDFSRDPELGGKLVANAPGPGKRPRSSMSPTIVLDPNGDVFMVTGSPGGNSIIGYVSKTLVAVLDWGRTAQEAASLPNIVARGETVRVETADDTGKRWAQDLRSAGFKVQEVNGEVSGLHVIVAREDHLEGGADPRREGKAEGIVRAPPKP
ncbi:MAG: gamma-glutamyltransferase [Hyphomonadaceae bacterium]